MKKSKTIVSFLLALILISGFVTSAFAESYSASVSETLDSKITAPNVYLAETKTDRIIYSKGADEKVAPASLTKIVTALVVADKLKKEQEVTVSASALSSFKDGYIVSGLVAGEVVTVDELLNLLLIPSMNDAAVILAQEVSGSVEKFAVLMNEKAKKLGCTSTNFVTPYGEDNPNHYTTPKDMFIIAKEYLQNQYLMSISNQAGYNLPATNKNGSERHYEPTNYLLDKNSPYYTSTASGIKTGHTTGAGDCLISSASNESDSFIAVVMGADDSDGRKFSECSRLLEYAISNFSYTQIIKKGDSALFVETSKKGGVNAVYSKGLSTFLMNSESVSMPKIEIFKNISSAKAGDKVGTAEITVSGKTTTIDLTAENDAPLNLTPIIIAVIIGLLLIAVIVLILIKFKKNKPTPTLENKTLQEPIKKKVGDNEPENSKVANEEDKPEPKNDGEDYFNQI